jgi:predicted Zn-ribbon and HTH transcriptional regulator|tara:strand:+ start:213 stop:437 length:225 start_codon:yes stop_codon:yes gene_type:complete
MELTPKEEAKELLKRFESVSKPFMKGSEVQVHINPEHAKQCAFICVDEVINDRAKRGKINFTYWQEVKQEIEKL